MSVPVQTPSKEYIANGTTTAFPLEFNCDKAEYLIVTLNGEEAPVGSWTLANDTVTFNVAPVNGVVVNLQRNTPFQRTTNYQLYDNSFRPSAVNKDFDLIWWKLQELGVADWILSNRINDLRAYVDKQDNVLQDNIDSLKNYVDDKDDELRNYLLNAIQEQGVALDQLEEYYSYLMQQLAQVAIDRGWAASFIVSADGSTQQQVNDRIGNTWYAKPLGYELNARVMLTNGDIVRSTVANNTVDPNVDMTGWVLDNASSQIIDADGNPITIKPIPDFSSTETYIEGSLVIKDGLLQKLTGGVWRPKAATYYDFGAKIDGITDDTDAFIAYHKKFKKANLDGRMHLRPIDIDQFISNQNLGLDISGDGNTKSCFVFDGEKGFYSASNSFFRGLSLKNIALEKKDPTKTGIGLYIGSGGAEQINLEFVGYDGWGFGRATHQWNSSFVGEVFRDCKHPLAVYGTSSNHSNCYANRCTSPYLFGYAVSSDGVVTVPSIPFAYSDLSGIAADDCGNDGSVYKIGYCSGIDLNSLSCERAQGEYIFDLTDVSQSAISKTYLNNFSMYVNEYNPNLVGIFKSPTGKRPNFIIDGITISSDKNIVLFSGTGAGCEIKNYSFNDKVLSSLTTDVSALTVNDVQIGDGVESIGEQGYILAANNDAYSRVKTIKGRCFIDPATQKLTFFGGSLYERLAAGIMVACKVTLHPLNRNGNNSGEKHGEVFFSSAMDYNATDMSGHLNVVRTGTLTTLTTVSRNLSTGSILSFDLVVEVTSPGTRFLINFEYTYNGIQNVNGKCWTVQNK